MNDNQPFQRYDLLIKFCISVSSENSVLSIVVVLNVCKPLWSTFNKTALGQAQTT